jgi:peptidoglycan hydrolase CwlO-like protein
MRSPSYDKQDARENREKVLSKIRQAGGNGEPDELVEEAARLDAPVTELTDDIDRTKDNLYEEKKEKRGKKAELEALSREIHDRSERIADLIEEWEEEYH